MNYIYIVFTLHVKYLQKRSFDPNRSTFLIGCFFNVTPYLFKIIVKSMVLDIQGFL